MKHSTQHHACLMPFDSCDFPLVEQFGHSGSSSNLPHSKLVMNQVSDVIASAIHRCCAASLLPLNQHLNSSVLSTSNKINKLFVSWKTNQHQQGNPPISTVLVEPTTTAPRLPPAASWHLGARPKAVHQRCPRQQKGEILQRTGMIP